jgi:hypothetical protein
LGFRERYSLWKDARSLKGSEGRRVNEYHQAPPECGGL